MNTLQAVYRAITVDLHPDDPGPTPPSWVEVEWCDEGGSCEHPACLDALNDDEHPPGACPSCGHGWIDHHERDGCGACALSFTRSCKQWPDGWAS